MEEEEGREGEGDKEGGQKFINDFPPVDQEW